MAQPIIPIFTLRQIIDEQNISVSNNNVVVVDIDYGNIGEIELNYPRKTICLGVMLITSGEATINVDFQEMGVQKMDIVNLFPENTLEFKSFSPDCKMKVVLVSLDYFSEINFQINSQEAFDVLSNNYTKITSLNEDVFNNIKYNMDRLQKLNHPDHISILSPEMLKLYFTLIIYEIANFSKTQTKNNDFISFRKEDIAIKFVSMVAQNFKDHRDVQYYADKMSISRKHLTRTIKEVFHKVPKHIIEDKIIVEAKMLLLKNELNITQVINELNFENQSAFSNFFKKNTGLNPSSYRKQIQQ